MPVKADKVKFAIGDKVTFDMDGTDVKGEITKLKGSNYIVEDDEGTHYECEPSELTAAKKGKAAASAAADEEEETPKKKTKKPAADEEEETPKKKAKPMTGGWNSTKPVVNTGAGGFPVGTWEALAFNGAAEEKEGKGVNAYIEYVGVHDDDVNGKKQRQYFNIKDDAGNWGEGVGYFKGALVTLGYDEDSLEIDEDDLVEDLNRLLKKLRKMEPWVSLKVKEGKSGYTNVYLNGLMDDQNDKPTNPLAE